MSFEGYFSETRINSSKVNKGVKRTSKVSLCQT